MMKNFAVNKTEKEWKEELSPKQYEVLREKGTEYPHTGKYNLHFEKGSYFCAGCGQKLFESEAKFRSDCRWPRFDEAIEESEDYEKDKCNGLIRKEVMY